LLSITGEDTIIIDRKFREAWTGRLQARFPILSNELPCLADASGALASRFIVLC
jgi:putative DNA primase/helicase